MPVGAPPPPEMVQLPTRAPVSVYLKTLSVVESLTTQRCTPSVTMPVGFLLPLLRLKLPTAFWLPVRRLAAPVFLKTLSLLLSTIHMSVLLVAMPSGVALAARLPAVQEPSKLP